MSTYQYRPGNLHDANYAISLKWGCGHFTMAWMSKLNGIPPMTIDTEDWCAQCALVRLASNSGMEAVQ